MGREGQVINAHGLDIQWQFAGGLYGVGVEEDIAGAADSGDFLNWKDNASLIVGEHDGYHRGVFSDGFVNGVHINLPGAVHGNPSDVTATFLVVLAKLDIGRVLYGGGNKVAFAGPAKQGGVQGGVISLGAAGVKNNLARIGIDQTGDLFAGGGQGGAELLAKAVGTGGVSPVLSEVGQHSLDHLGRDARGGVVVEIINRLLAHGGGTAS